jgi:hypothetical protein
MIEECGQDAECGTSYEVTSHSKRSRRRLNSNFALKQAHALSSRKHTLFPSRCHDHDDTTTQTPIMINAVLVFNNNGQPRLTKFYTQLVRSSTTTLPLHHHHQSQTS